MEVYCIVTKDSSGLNDVADAWDKLAHMFITMKMGCAIPPAVLPCTKWPPFRKRHSQTHFLEWKISIFDKKFTEVLS